MCPRWLTLHDITPAEPRQFLVHLRREVAVLQLSSRLESYKVRPGSRFHKLVSPRRHPVPRQRPKISHPPAPSLLNQKDRKPPRGPFSNVARSRKIRLQHDSSHTAGDFESVLSRQICPSAPGSGIGDLPHSSSMRHFVYPRHLSSNCFPWKMNSQSHHELGKYRRTLLSRWIIEFSQSDGQLGEMS